MSSANRQSVTPKHPNLWQLITPGELAHLIHAARTEDLGPQGRDITSELTIPRAARTRAVMRSRVAGRLSGAVLLPAIARAYGRPIKVEMALHDGAELAPGSVVATFRGPLRTILAMERTALNFVTHLSGIATLTATYVAATAGTRAVICDTRKTIPGLRGLEKYAVACGGGQSHRMGLYDAVLVKDNHLAHVPPQRLTRMLDAALRRARRLSPPPVFVEVEVDTLQQLGRVLAIAPPARPDIVLLDNMTVPQLARAVTMREKLAPGAPGTPGVLLEASGGVNLRNVGAVAATGVDRIGIGALTHSAPALDLGLDIN